MQAVMRSVGLSDAGLQAWAALLESHSHLMEALDSELQSAHGVAIGDYDVLAQLTIAPGGRRRMCDLADAVLLSPSGLSRRVERLERSGLVARERSKTDARSVEAALTPQGAELFEELSRTHLAGVRRRFVDVFSAEELQSLEQLLGRLGAPDRVPAPA